MSVKIHLHKRQQREEVPKKMSCSKFVNLAKMGSNLLTKSSSMRPLSTSAASRFCNDIPPDQNSAKTNTKIEEKDTVITDVELDTMFGTTWKGFRPWKRDSKDPNIIIHEICSSSEGCYITKTNFKK